MKTRGPAERIVRAVGRSAWWCVKQLAETIRVGLQAVALVRRPGIEGEAHLRFQADRARDQRDTDRIAENQRRQAENDRLFEAQKRKSR